LPLCFASGNGPVFIRFEWQFPIVFSQECSTSSISTQLCSDCTVVGSSWNVMEQGDARDGKWRGNWRMEWVATTFHTTSEHGVSSITTADAHTSAASSRLNWRPLLFKWTRTFRRKTKSGFCACAITFQMQSTPLQRVAQLSGFMQSTICHVS
jgi:hypothetical protein